MGSSPLPLVKWPKIEWSQRLNEPLHSGECPFKTGVRQERKVSVAAAYFVDTLFSSSVNVATFMNSQFVLGLRIPALDSLRWVVICHPILFNINRESLYHGFWGKKTVLSLTFLLKV